MRISDHEARLLELNRLEGDAKENLSRTTPVYFKSANHHLPVFKVEIDFPKYRIENGRTKRKQILFKHEHPDRAHLLDDPSSDEAQEIQESILMRMVDDEGLIDLLHQGQHEPLLLSYDGYVVNGNRRLAAMRQIHSDPKLAKSTLDFSSIDVARLPELPEKEIRRIEARLQMSKDGKADYNWVDELLLIDENLSTYEMRPEDLARDMNKRKSTIELQQMMLLLVNQFLEKNNMKGQYFTVEADEQAFKTLAKGYQAIRGNLARRERLVDAAFPMISFPEPGESKHKRILKLIDNLDTVVEHANNLLEKTQVPELATPPEDSLSNVRETDQVRLTPLEINRESSEVIHEAIRQVDRKNQIEDAANGPYEAAAQAATLVKTIKITNKTTKISQLRGQLKVIRKSCDELLEQLGKQD